jgi:hypothetical protein
MADEKSADLIRPDHSDKIVSEVLEMPTLKEKHLVAHMDEEDTNKLQCIFEKYIESKWGLCLDSKDIVKSLWTELCESHRLRVVGSFDTD